MRFAIGLLACVACGSDGGGKPKDAMPDGDSLTADAKPSGPLAVYVGAGDDQIHSYAFDTAQIRLTARDAYPTGDGPSFLAFGNGVLVAVNEGADAVELFGIGNRGMLARVNARPSGGSGPAHVAVDATGKWALVANYGSGHVAVLPIGTELGAAVSVMNAGANAHQIVLNAANTVAYVPCLGANYIAVYDFDAATGALTPRSPVMAPAGAGPRHIALHPDGTRAFVIDEKTSTITSYTIEADGDLVLRGGETVSTLPGDFSGTNTGAEIAVNQAGTYLYASNRGHDSIVRFRITANALTDPQHVSVFGMKPRHFSLVLDDTVMLVAKQGSGAIHAFRIRASDGVPTPVGEVATATSAAFVGAIGVSDTL